MCDNVMFMPSHVPSGSAGPSDVHSLRTAVWNHPYLDGVSPEVVLHSWDDQHCKSEGPRPPVDLFPSGDGDGIPIRAFSRPIG